MPYYALTYITAENFVERRMPYREQHLLLAQQYHDNQILLAGGSMQPAIESLLIFHCENEDVVKSFMRQDPYVQNGLVKAWYIREWNIVIGDKFIKKEK
ncbi:YciI family protein [Terrimonas rubra]|uniref:YciI family protein n=1 Tax=Terrimonas rubra TaxID=1035890 RepID=A0ABW6A3M5_9BACT